VAPNGDWLVQHWCGGKGVRSGRHP
jgi:hypothetical protein